MTENIENRKFMKERYLLDKLPFAIKESRSSVKELWVNRVGELAQWKKLVEKTINGGQNTISYIVGDYGMGKTMSLFKIMSEYSQRSDVFPLYFTIKSESVHSGSIDFIFRLFENIEFIKLIENRSKNDIARSLDKIPNEAKFSDSKNAYSYMFKLPSQNKLDLGDTEWDPRSAEITLIRNLLTGKKLTTAEKKELKGKLKISHEIEIDTAKYYLSSLLIFMKGLGYRAMIILVDEFEYLFSMIKKTDRPKYFALFRSLFDLSDEVDVNPDEMVPLMIFFGISQDGYAYLNELETRSKYEGPTPFSALKRRVEKETVLTGMNKEDCKLLIEKRLGATRVIGKEAKPPIIPFSDDFVGYISEITGGRPSNIIDYCDHVLEEGMAKRIDLISADFAKKVLREKGFFTSDNQKAD